LKDSPRNNLSENVCAINHFFWGGGEEIYCKESMYSMLRDRLQKESMYSMLGDRLQKESMYSMLGDRLQKIVPLTNLNKYLHNATSETEVNMNM